MESVVEKEKCLFSNPGPVTFSTGQVRKFQKAQTRQSLLKKAGGNVLDKKTWSVVLMPCFFFYMESITAFVKCLHACKTCNSKFNSLKTILAKRECIWSQKCAG